MQYLNAEESEETAFISKLELEKFNMLVTEKSDDQSLVRSNRLQNQSKEQYKRKSSKLSYNQQKPNQSLPKNATYSNETAFNKLDNLSLINQINPYLHQLQRTYTTPSNLAQQQQELSQRKQIYIKKRNQNKSAKIDCENNLGQQPEILMLDAQKSLITVSSLNDQDQMKLKAVQSLNSFQGENHSQKYEISLSLLQELKTRLETEIANNEKLQEQVVSLKDYIKHKQNESNNDIQKLINQNKALVQQNNQYQLAIDKLSNQIEIQQKQINQYQKMLESQFVQMSMIQSQSLNASPRSIMLRVQKANHNTKIKTQKAQFSPTAKDKIKSNTSQGFMSKVQTKNTRQELMRSTQDFKSKIFKQSPIFKNAKSEAKFQQSPQLRINVASSCQKLKLDYNRKYQEVDKDAETKQSDLNNQISALMSENTRLKNSNDQLNKQMRKIRIKLLENVFANTFQTTPTQKQSKIPQREKESQRSNFLSENSFINIPSDESFLESFILDKQPEQIQQVDYQVNYTGKIHGGELEELKKAKS